MILNRCPKTVLAGRKRLRLAVADATVVYNGGEQGRFPIFERLGMPVGFYTKQCFANSDGARRADAQAQAAPEAKQQRQLQTLDAALQDGEADREEFHLARGREYSEVGLPHVLGFLVAPVVEKLTSFYVWFIILLF